MVRINKVEIKNQSWMEVIINQEDGYINGTKLADQEGMSLSRSLNLEGMRESVEHIKMLTGNKEKYEGESSWYNVKGQAMDGEDVGVCRMHKATTQYIHLCLALEMVAIRKCEDG